MMVNKNSEISTNQENLKNTRKSLQVLQHSATDKENLIRSGENLKNTRKSLQVLQHSATDKENLIRSGRMSKDVKDSIYNPDSKAVIKTKKLAHKSTQADTTHNYEQTIKDLTSDEPSLEYWKSLVETQRVSLDKSFVENEELYNDNNSLKEIVETQTVALEKSFVEKEELFKENNSLKEMLRESNELTELLTEMLDEKEKEEEPKHHVD